MLHMWANGPVSTRLSRYGVHLDQRPAGPLERAGTARLRVADHAGDPEWEGNESLNGHWEDLSAASPGAVCQKCTQGTSENIEQSEDGYCWHRNPLDAWKALCHSSNA